MEGGVPASAALVTGHQTAAARAGRTSAGTRPCAQRIRLGRRGLGARQPVVDAHGAPVLAEHADRRGDRAYQRGRVLDQVFLDQVGPRAAPDRRRCVGCGSGSRSRRRRRAAGAASCWGGGPAEPLRSIAEQSVMPALPSRSGSCSGGKASSSRSSERAVLHRIGARNRDVTAVEQGLERDPSARHGSLNSAAMRPATSVAQRIASAFSARTAASWRPALTVSRDRGW